MTVSKCVFEVTSWIPNALSLHVWRRAADQPTKYKATLLIFLWWHGARCSMCLIL